MPEESIVLASKRTDQLPASAGPQAGFQIPMWNTLLQRTEKVDVANFTSSTVTGDFEWLSTTTYAINVAVTRAGKWWQSQQADNLNHIPGTDPAWWVEISKQSSWKMWASGVYVEDRVFVLYEILERTLIFELSTEVVRPFVSSNFVDELADGTWKPVNKKVEITLVNTEPETDFLIDLMNVEDGIVIIDGSITSHKNIDFINTLFAKDFLIVATFDAAYNFVFDDSINRHKYDGGFNTEGVNVWSASEAGIFLFSIKVIAGSVYIEKIDGPYVNFE